MDSCVFCKIVTGEIPSYKIYEDEKTLGFLDISQVNDGHILLMPKEHVRWVWSIKNVGEFFEVAKKIVNKVQEVTGEEFVFTQTIGQLVPHAHFHIVPNTEGNLNIVLEAWGKAREMRKLDNEKMEELVRKLRI